jgi:hypothetical protein
MYYIYKDIINQTNQPMVICLEPWGTTLELPAQQIFDIVAQSSVRGDLEIVVQEKSNEIELWGWDGATLKVFFEREQIHEETIPVPYHSPDFSL